MRRVIGIALGCVLCFGCRPAEPNATVLRSHELPEFENGRAAPNLALGPSATNGQIAETLNYRSDWPAARWGYRFDDTRFYIDNIYDNQTFYDDLGGVYFNNSQSFHTGVIVR